MRKRPSSPVFGVVSPRERRAADLFFAELVGAAPRRRAIAIPTEDDPPPYRTGALRSRPGWTYVAYLDQREVRLGFNVNNATPANRIGNIGWVTNNPGSLDLNPPSQKTPICARVVVKHGAFEKNTNDIATYRRFAVFPSEQKGAAAILPMMFCLARYNNNASVSGALGMFYGIQDATLRTRYVDQIRARLVRSYEQQLRLTDPGLSDQARAQRAADLANGLLARPTLELERFVTYDSQYLEAAILDVESTRDMARIGLLFRCSGFQNLGAAQAAYDRDTAKRQEIQALVDSTAVDAELKGVLGCTGAIQV